MTRIIQKFYTLTLTQVLKQNNHWNVNQLRWLANLTQQQRALQAESQTLTACADVTFFFSAKCA